MNKTTFREKCLKIRKEIKEKDRKSTIICEKLLFLDIYKTSNTIAAYWALPNEVDLFSFVKRVLKDGKTIVLPRVVNNQLFFYQYHLGDELEESSFHVFEPKIVDKNYLNNKDIDLFIVPGLAFDKDNNRMGYGKGFYDRTLKETPAFKIGVTFKELKFKEIPHDENDIKMDVVIND